MRTSLRFWALILICVGLQGCATPQSTNVAGRAEATPAPPAAPASLSWLSGTWMSEPDDARIVTEEHWMMPRGGSMIGMNRAASGERTVFFEFLHIESRDDGVYYLASPAGRQPPTPFKLVESRGTMVVFENLEHDFPQRITYERDRDTLRMRTEGVDKGQPRSESWTLTRSRDGSPIRTR